MWLGLNNVNNTGSNKHLIQERLETDFEGQETYDIADEQSFCNGNKTTDKGRFE